MEQQITLQQVAAWYRPRRTDSHKGDYGRALLVAGSRGMMGAALLSARACMHSGVGLLTACVPACGYDIMQLGIPEAKCQCDDCATHHRSIALPPDTEVLGIGPGLGQHPDTQRALYDLLQPRLSLPMVVDADALNILALHPDWLSLLPASAILTPHPGEMRRLGDHPQHLAERYGLTVVLKGATTRIFTPAGLTMVHCDHGNPGMAVGGSGDVLTGIILALLAQHYPADVAAAMGVWLHAEAADVALTHHHSHESLLPSDVIAALGDAFRALL